MKKSLFVRLAMLIFTLGLFGFVPGFTVKAEAKTTAEVVSWMDSKVGKSLDYDGAYGAQCVDLVNFYMRDVWGISNPIGQFPVQYAYQMINYPAPAGWTKITGSGNYKVGDMIIFKNPNSTTGHVGIIYSISGSTVKMLNQNNNSRKYCTIDNILSYVTGVFRPPISDPVGPAVSKTETVKQGRYMLQNAGSGYIFNYAYGTSGEKKPIWMSNKEGSPEQIFKFEYAGNGQYVLRSTAVTSDVVNIYRGSGTPAAGDSVTGYAYSGSGYQKFYITPVSGGYVLQSASNTNVVIAAPSKDFHAQLQLQNYQAGNTLQIWKLEYLDTPAEVALPFTDVPKGSWFYDSVKYVYTKNIMTGKTATTFAPTENVSRAQFATILYRMAGSPAVTYKNKFPDVADGQFYSKAVIWAAENGIVTGHGDGTFKPGDPITREQMALMMFRYGNYKKYNTADRASFASFPDADKVSSYAVEAMQWAVAKQIITGKNGKLEPAGKASRAECATIIMRFMKAYT